MDEAAPLGLKGAHLQDDGAPHQVEDSKHDVFVIVLPVKRVVRDANDSHGYQGKRKVLQEAKVQGLTFAKVVANGIWRDRIKVLDDAMNMHFDQNTSLKHKQKQLVTSTVYKNKKDFGKDCSS